MKTIQEINSLLYAWKADEIEFEDVAIVMNEQHREIERLNKLVENLKYQKMADMPLKEQ